MISCHVYTPSGKKLDLQTEIVSIGTTDGRRGILPGHMPIILTVQASRFSTLVNGVHEHYAVSDGILSFRNNECNIFVDAIESQKDIDVERAQKAAERANKRISSPKPNTDLRRAEIALRKALNRIQVSSYRE